MAGITFAVYDPPKPGLPYLAVAIFTNGEVSAVGYKTAAEAEKRLIFALTERRVVGRKSKVLIVLKRGGAA